MNIDMNMNTDTDAETDIEMDTDTGIDTDTNVAQHCRWSDIIDRFWGFWVYEATICHI
jgi:hypothetical protein